LFLIEYALSILSIRRYIKQCKLQLPHLFRASLTHRTYFWSVRTRGIISNHF